MLARATWAEGRTVKRPAIGPNIPVLSTSERLDKGAVDEAAAHTSEGFDDGALW